MAKASDLSITGEKLSFLFKGSPGYGKTLAAASFAVLGPIYLAYFDKKSPIEIKTYFTKLGRKDLLDNIEYDVYGADNVNKYLNKMVEMKQSGCRYVAVITDSLTQLTASAVNWSMGFNDSQKKSKDIQVTPGMDEYKVETGLVGLAIDACKGLPCHIIWTAHPLAGIKMEGSGQSMRVTKTNPLVSYGSKVASMIPGNFTEIYHFAKDSSFDNVTGKAKVKNIVCTDAVGDEMAKSALGIAKEFDITDRLFYEVWREELKKVA